MSRSPGPYGTRFTAVFHDSRDPASWHNLRIQHSYCVDKTSLDYMAPYNTSAMGVFERLLVLETIADEEFAVTKPR